MTDDRFDHCLVCEKPSTRYGCSDCRNRVGQMLRDLELYTTEFLPLMTQPARGQTGRMSPGYGSRSPARDDVLTALDPRSRPGDVDEDGEAILRSPDDAGSWPRSLTSSAVTIAKWIAEERDELRPRSFGGALDYIRNLLWWLAGRSDFDELFDDVAELHRQARELSGDRPQKPLGECLNVTCDGTVRWGGPGKPAQCGVCRRTYDGLDWVRLAVANNLEVA
ncbi:hypothetical protein SD37_11625 [Amycolatopsis orientalis]|uniref:Uncharacterized protein n=1 Tax=Amycolatopsis orientalis TaxID=31958 RepID=A0A193BVH8_AMYOR|nr:hypothetical protein [Amycolatopsis orientalis]ANN16227.1 hypothetical protein SD37_11625 [Amycolatopsis orientalis]